MTTTVSTEIFFPRDMVLIVLPGIGTLQMPIAVYNKHLIKPVAESKPKAPTEILDADQLETRTGVPASWWMTQARDRRVPFLKFGRYVRFNFDEVIASDVYKRRAK